MSINERIKVLIEHLNMNANSFSKYIGISNNVTIGRLINSSSHNPSFDIIKSILQKCSDIDANWLITGEGNMFKNANAPPGGDDCLKYKELLDEIASLKYEKTQLYKLNGALLDQLEEHKKCSKGEKRKAG